MGKIDEWLLLIKQKREEKGISQKEMANYLGISQPAYNNIESGVTALKAEILFPIAKILDIDFHVSSDDDKPHSLTTLNPLSNIVTKINKIDEIDEKISENSKDIKEMKEQFKEFFKLFGGDNNKKKK